MSRRLNRVSFVFASGFCFTLAFLSLFALNYSSTFNLLPSIAHATDSSTTDLVLDAPTTIAIAVTGSNPQCTGDELDTSESAVPATAQLCLKWNDDNKTATGTQTVSVRTNSPYGYSLNVNTGAGQLLNDQRDYLIFTCSANGGKDCAYSRNDFSDQDNQYDFAYIITSSKPKQQLSAGDYAAGITYIATAYSAWGDGGRVVNSDGQTVYNFDYTGADQKFIVPKAGKYRIELWGASGGGAHGGHGGYTAGAISLDENNELYIYVGGHEDRTNGSCDRVPYTFNNAQWGGGGYHYTCASGGGATDIRLAKATSSHAPFDFNSLRSRIMAAGGGGGDYYSVFYQDDAYSGDSGGLIGYQGAGYDHSLTDHAGGPGTQTGGGPFGYAINGTTTPGGGYYSGARAQASNSSGGSSYISGHNGCVAIAADSTEGNIKQRTGSSGQACTDGTTDITCSYHYSGYKFTNTVMIDGAGYNWTTARGDYVGQPQPDGSIAAGHSGNGYARITYLGK